MKPFILLSFALSTFAGVLIGCDQKPADGEPSSTAANEQVLPRGKITRFGLFRERGRGWVQDNAKSSTGKVIRGATLEFIETENTDRVALRKGVIFGYRYWLKFASNQERVSLKRVLIHPEMTLPGGAKVTRSERDINKKTTNGIVTSIDAYTLSEDYELVEGDWIFQLWFSDKLLAEQKFTTY